MIIDKNIPNYLTILRMISIPLIIMTFYLDDYIFARRLGGSIFIAASLTDFLDGYIARKFNIVSRFGKTFDPIADKVLVACVLLMLVKNGRANEIPCLLILAREFIVSGLRESLIRSKISVPVSNLAKTKTVLQMTAITILIIGTKGSGIPYIDEIGSLMLWVSTILTLISGYSYYKSCSQYFYK
ncbi:MAG: hypothetical protein DGJ47_000923 [Rickettsiaceae bacterium]